MKCKDKFYLYKGQCFRQCPSGTAAQPGTRECQGKQPPHPVPAVPGDVPGAEGSPICPCPRRDVRAGAVERVERLHPREPDLRLQVGSEDAGAGGAGGCPGGWDCLPRAAGDQEVPHEEALPRR